VAKAGTLPFDVIGDRCAKLPGLPALLKRHGLSKKQFAEKVGTSPAWITQLSNQATRGSAGRVIATFNELGIKCSIDELAEAALPEAGAA
jgi:transcriptional regulator with XRE-family HTH domain